VIGLVIIGLESAAISSAADMSELDLQILKRASFRVLLSGHFLLDPLLQMQPLFIAVARNRMNV
jgi:hypothetical protein